MVGGWKTRKGMKVADFRYDALADPEWALIQSSNTSTTDDGEPYDQQYDNPLRELAAGNPRART